jgi:hypothetical protein
MYPLSTAASAGYVTLVWRKDISQNCTGKRLQMLDSLVCLHNHLQHLASASSFLPREYPPFLADACRWVSTMSQAAEAAMAASYKQLKEDFVSGLTGGDILEINYVTAVASVR